MLPIQILPQVPDWGEEACPVNHKRGRPKSRRAGCLLCKWHKEQKLKDTLKAQTMQERKAREREKSF